MLNKRYEVQAMRKGEEWRLEYDDLDIAEVVFGALKSMSMEEVSLNDLETSTTLKTWTKE